MRKRVLKLLIVLVIGFVVNLVIGNVNFSIAYTLDNTVPKEWDAGAGQRYTNIEADPLAYEKPEDFDVDWKWLLAEPTVSNVRESYPALNNNDRSIWYNSTWYKNNRLPKEGDGIEYLRIPYIEKECLLARRRYITDDRMIGQGQMDPQIYFYSSHQFLADNNHYCLKEPHDGVRMGQIDTFGKIPGAYWCNGDLECMIHYILWGRNEFYIDSEEAIFLNRFDNNAINYTKTIGGQTYSCRKDAILQCFFLKMCDWYNRGIAYDFVAAQKFYNDATPEAIKNLYIEAIAEVKAEKENNDALKETKSVVTNADGKSFSNGEEINCLVGESVKLTLSKRDTTYTTNRNSYVLTDDPRTSTNKVEKVDIYGKNVVEEDGNTEKHKNDNPYRKKIGDKYTYKYVEGLSNRAKATGVTLSWSGNTCTINIGEDVDSSTVYVVIPYKYKKYEAYYDSYHNYRGVNTVIDPGERFSEIKLCKIIKINIAANVSINQYIETADGNSVQYLKKENNVWQLKDPSSRASWSETTKKNQSAVLENGAKIVYKLTITNKQTRNIYVKFEDTLPNCFVGQTVQISKGSSTNTIALPNNGVIGFAQWPGVIKYSHDENDSNFLDEDDTRWKINDYLQVPKRQKVDGVWKDGEVTFTITTTVSSTTGYNTLREAKAKIDGVRWLVKTKDDGTKVFSKKFKAKKGETSDFFRIKDYNVAIDKYISKVEHQYDRGGTLTTYSSEARRLTTDVAPVSVEYGDRITYTIRIYNTTGWGEYNIGDRRGAPYREPQYIDVDIADTLPANYSGLTVSRAYTAEGQTIKFNNVRVEADGVTEIIVSLIVEDVTRMQTRDNTVTLTAIRNRNGYAVKNHSTRTTAKDTYQLNDYNAGLEEYIVAYNAEMAKYNNANGFTNGESEGFYNSMTSYPNNSPLEVEKYETLTFTTKVTNNAMGGEEESANGAYGKYNTRVRPTTVEVALGAGLSKTGFRAEWYYANGTLKGDITRSISISGNSHSITDDNIILSPGEYILYITDVKVMESNLCLNNIGASSKITKLTNINKDNINEREVTKQNIASKTTDEDYVRLKDVVIAGTVWEDTSRDGVKNETGGKEKVVVKLYKVGQATPVATTTTDANGFYTFKRVQKADKDGDKNYRGSHYEYFVEFEYDGVTYKATEVYGGDNDGDGDGMHNLGGRQGSSTWRQGYSDLPDAKSGSENYKTDSNAYEFDDVRNAFDSEYQTIGFNKSYKGTEPNMDLAYDKNGHESKLKENPNRVMRARSFMRQNYGSEVKEGLDNTNKLFLAQYEGYSNTYPETEYLKFINLGLVKREEVDISIESDVHSVKTTINGEEMTYDYYKNDANSTLANYNLQQNAYKLNQAYNLNLYQSDYNYRNDTYYIGDGNYDANAIENYKKNESELATEVTYRIKIHNNKIQNDEPYEPKVEDVPVEIAINEMAIYYNNNFVKDWNEKRTVKVKNEETGMLEDRQVSAIRVNYGTEDELDKLMNSTENSKTGITISANSNYGNAKPSDESMSSYNVLYLTGGKLADYIREGEIKYIQITFTVDKDTARNLKLTKEDMGFEMVSEVSAYTTKYSESYTHKALAGKHAGLVDKDSNPGNLHLNGIENYDNYEDDKYKVGITIDKFPQDTPSDSLEDPAGKRSVTGVVWEDARSEEVEGKNGSAVQYIGNGMYQVNNINKGNTNPYNPSLNLQSEDRAVAGVKVSLIEVVQTEADIYYEYPARYTYNFTDAKGEEHHTGELIETVTDVNGKYILTDFIPGYYKVKFDYGYDETRKDNIIYNGQDYKSTKYYNEALYYEEDKGYKTDNIGSKDNFDYFDQVKTALKVEKRSDAQDDEIRRLNVNSYSETMTMTEAKLFYDVKDIVKDLEGRRRDAERLTRNTHMYAESAIFYVKPEEVNSSDKNITADSSNIGSEESFGTAGFDETRLWNIKSLDFGLEYRPEVSIILDKDISTIELVTSDDKTLIKLYFEKDINGDIKINEEKSKGYQNIQFLPNEEKLNQGFAYINMDTKILEGCTIKVEYQMDASNKSEVDRINENLHEIRYEMRAAKQNYKGIFYSNNYNANGTAAETLSQKYYAKKNEEDYYRPEDGKEVYSYLKKIKKPYKVIGETQMGNVKLAGTEYYGIYLGQTYYTGRIGDKDIVAQLKVDHILDYIDNDFTFNLAENNTKNKLWQTTTSKELREANILDFSKVYVDNDRELNLVDKNGIRYDTENRSNLALSVDDNKNGKYEDGQDRNGNVSLSRFLTTNKESDALDKYRGFIRAIASKVLSADDVAQGTGLSYENMAEVVQYTSLTGRRTKLPEGEGGGVIGNANVNESWNGYNKYEDDTDATEVITITPPTGK